MSDNDAAVEAQLAAIAKQCRLGPYFLQKDFGKRVLIRVPPYVRALPLEQSKVDCARARLEAIGLQLATGASAPRTKAELQSLLDAIHRDCKLGPYELKARSAKVAVLTISPTLRVDPLTSFQHHCAKTRVENIPGVTFGPSIAPMVD